MDDSISSIEDMASICRARQRADFDITIGICADEGIGKTTLANLLGMEIGKVKTKKAIIKFVENNVVYNPNPEKIQEVILYDKLPRYSAVVIDEAIKTMYKRQWQSKINTFINQVFAICRKRNKAIILCMPRFRDFDTFFREGRIKVWIQIVKRGYAVVFIKDSSPFVTDPWHIDENQKILKKSIGRRKIKDFGTDELIASLRKCKNYCGEFSFGKMPKIAEDRYKELADEVRFELGVEIESGMLRAYREACAKLLGELYKKIKVTQQELADLSGLSLGQVNKLLRKVQAGAHNSKNPKAE